ncbi:hypothetical protein [Vibrio nereis]|uniref:hypothetical protein n=1 Tax=Vibrio nereis TaxID=693 RepID=UPI002494641D|nr:hypothetical protein [Vibrio nereis]
MGLKEKKAAREFQEQRLDDLVSRAHKAAKFEFEFDIDWDSISVDNFSHLYDQTWSLIYFEPLINAMEELCDDKFYQEAIAEDMKKVVIHNVGDLSKASAHASYSEGTLTLNHSPIYNADNQINDRKEAIKEAIEKAL